MYYRISMILLFFSLLNQTNAQRSQLKVNNQWFAKNFVIDWRSGEPVVRTLFPEELASNTENSSFVCDPSTGDLLLFTDGAKLYDGRMNLIHKNVGGRNSTHQNSIIAPTSDSTFLVIGNGSLQGIDEGNVLSIHQIYYNKKTGTSRILNTQRTPDNFTAFEMLALAPNPSKPCSFWLIIMGDAANKIYAVPIEKSGVLNFDEAVISPVDAFPENDDVLRGHISLSDDYSKVSIGMQSRGIIVGDFDKNTGVFSNFSEVLTDTTETGYCSIFSPDNSKLYYVFGYFGYHGKVFQLDIASRKRTILSEETGFGGFSLGPDGNIYVSGKRKKYYAAIKQPNSLNPQFDEKAIFLGAANSATYSPGVLSIFDLNSNCVVERYCDTTYTYEALNICTPFEAESGIIISKDTLLNHLEKGENQCLNIHQKQYYFRNDSTILPIEFTCAGVSNNDTSIYENKNGCDSIVIQPYVSISTIPSDTTLYLCPSEETCFLNHCYQQEGVYTDTLHSDAGNCSKVITIEVKEAFKFTKEINRTLCLGEYLVVDTDTLRETGVYTFRYTSKQGCDSVVLFNIDVLEFNDFIYIDTSVCIGDTLDLPNGTPLDIFDKYAYLKDLQTPRIPVNHDFVIEEVSKNCYGQELDVSIFIRAATPPNIELDIPNPLSEGKPTGIQFNTASTNHVLLYQDNEAIEATGDSLLFTPTYYSSYRLEIVSEEGCRNSYPLELNVRPQIFTCEDANFNIPNFISPNGDGLNDEFRFSYDHVMSIENLSVYDRWGGVVFDTNQPLTEFWDGRVNQQKGQADVFVYKITYTCSDGATKIEAGNITVAY